MSPGAYSFRIRPALLHLIAPLDADSIERCATSKVCVKRYVRCPFSAAIELAEKVLGRRGDLYITPSAPVGERVTFATATATDITDDVRKHDALLLTWSPQRAGMFPKFSGSLTVRPKGRGVWLRLSGEYEPPYGPAGKVFDFVLGRSIASATMRNLLDELAQDVENEYREEQRRYNKTA
jgi:hypothetical protein